MKVLVIVPTYNERKNLAELVAKIFSLGLAGLEVLVIDDNSPDGTGQLAEQLKGKHPLTVIHRSKKEGLGSAYLAGFALALKHNFAAVLEMDADFSHDPADLPRLLNALTQGYDLVIGSRRTAGGKIIGWSVYRHLFSWGANWFSRLCLGLQTKDVTAGFRAFQTPALARLPLTKIHSNGYAFQEELLFWAEKKGLKIKEIPVSFLDRQQGKSKLGAKDIYEFFMIILRLRRQKFL